MNTLLYYYSSCVSSQKIHKTISSGQTVCPGEIVHFTCTMRGSQRKFFHDTLIISCHSLGEWILWKVQSIHQYFDPFTFANHKRNHRVCTQVYMYLVPLLCCDLQVNAYSFVYYLVSILHHAVLLYFECLRKPINLQCPVLFVKSLVDLSCVLCDCIHNYITWVVWVQLELVHACMHGQ